MNVIDILTAVGGVTIVILAGFGLLVLIGAVFMAGNSK